MEEALKKFIINYLTSAKDINYEVSLNKKGDRLRIDHPLRSAPSFIVVMTDKVGEVYMASALPGGAGDKVCAIEVPVFYIGNSVMAMDFVRMALGVFRNHEEAEKIYKQHQEHENEISEKL